MTDPREKYRPGPPRGWVEFHERESGPAVAVSIRTGGVPFFFTTVDMLDGEVIDDFVRQALEAQKAWRSARHKDRVRSQPTIALNAFIVLEAIRDRMDWDDPEKPHIGGAVAYLVAQGYELLDVQMVCQALANEGLVLQEEGCHPVLTKAGDAYLARLRRDQQYQAITDTSPDHDEEPESPEAQAEEFRRTRAGVAAEHREGAGFDANDDCGDGDATPE